MTDEGFVLLLQRAQPLDQHVSLSQWATIAIAADIRWADVSNVAGCSDCLALTSASASSTWLGWPSRPLVYDTSQTTWYVVSWCRSSMQPTCPLSPRHSCPPYNLLIEAVLYDRVIALLMCCTSYRLAYSRLQYRFTVDTRTLIFKSWMCKNFPYCTLVIHFLSVIFLLRGFYTVLCTNVHKLGLGLSYRPS